MTGPAAFAVIVAKPAATPVPMAAGLVAVVLSSCGFVLTKTWTPPVDVVTATSWQLAAGGVVLVPIALVVEGAPPPCCGSAV